MTPTPAPAPTRGRVLLLIAVCMHAAAALRPGGGSRVRLAGAAVSANDILRFEYTPPPAFFKSGLTLTAIGGFNGWHTDADDAPVFTPMQTVAGSAEEASTYACVMQVPNFARSVEFVVSDGVRVDDNEGECFHMLVSHVLADGGDGKTVLRFEHDEASGELRPTGATVTHTPEEMLEIIEKGADAAAQAAGDGSGAEEDEEAGPAEEQMHVRAQLQLTEGVLADGEEDRFHEQSATGAVLGKQLGLGAIQVAEVREAFDRLSLPNGGGVPLDAMPKLLVDDLSFPLNQVEVEELVSQFCDSDGPVAFDTTLRIFAALDEANAGMEVL